MIDEPIGRKVIGLVTKRALEKSPQEEEWGLGIKRLPIFILYYGGKETNRIIESAIPFLEEEIKSIATLQLPPIITF